MRRQVNMILDAVKAVVPQSMWGDIVEKLDQLEQHPDALDVGEDGFDADDDATTRPSSSTRTTSFDLRSARRPRG